MRELWERQLFGRLLQQIREKGLDSERFFDLMDINGDNQLSTTEFRNGLYGLKIILNNQDLHNLFAIFDKDRSATITISELKDTLHFYQQLI